MWFNVAAVKWAMNDTRVVMGLTFEDPNVTRVRQMKTLSVNNNNTIY